MRRFITFIVTFTLLLSAGSPAAFACAMPADPGASTAMSADAMGDMPCAGDKNDNERQDCCDDDADKAMTCADCGCSVISSPAGAITALTESAQALTATAPTALAEQPLPDPSPPSLLRPPIV